MASDIRTGSSARDRLLRAARDAFALKGFHGTTTRDIAAAAGLSPAGVYVHHRSKEAMLFEISGAGHELMADLVEQAEKTHDDPSSQLHAMVHALVLVHARDHESARIVNYELEALTPEHRREIEAQRARIQTALRRVIESGLAAGEFDVDAVGMTVNAISGMSVDVGRWYLDDESWTPERIAGHFADIALRIVGAQPV